MVAEKFRSLVKELNAKCSKPLVSDHQMHLIFLNIGEIFVLNRQLLEDLQNRMDDWYDTSLIPRLHVVEHRNEPVLFVC